MFVIVQLVLDGVFCGNQSNCRNCRICILIGECCNGLDSLEILELVELPGKAGKDWNVWNALGRSCKTHGCISRRSPCLLCVEFLSGLKVSLPSGCSSRSSTRRALCLLHVELDSGWRILCM